LLISALVSLEVTNALELWVFRRQATRLEATKALAAFDSDVASGIFRLLPIPPAAWDAARKICRNRSADLGTRSSDVLHVGVALVFDADTFLTFDRNQAALARAEGLATPVSF
jgi:predicted nucleic acid-binding protein